MTTTAIGSECYLLEPIVLELDVAPTTSLHGGAIDFAGKQLAAFTRRRCLEPHPSGVGNIPSLLHRMNATDGSTSWTMAVDSSVVGSDGRQLDSVAIARLLSGYPDVENVHIYGPELHLRLKRPIACFPTILASDRFTVPSSLGLYDVVGGVQGRSIALRRSEIGEELWPSGPEAMIFAILPNAEQGVHGFEKALIDVTSNPNLPMAALQKYQDSPHLRRQELLMAGVLLFSSTKLVGTENARMRRSISHAIDRTTIVKRCGGTVSAIDSMFDLWDSTSGEPISDYVPLHRDAPKFLTLGYADFPPNGAVVEQISLDLADRLGIEVRAKALSYPEFLRCLSAPNCDMIYSLVQPMFDDPTSLLSFFGSESWLGPSLAPFTHALQEAQALDHSEDRVVACLAARSICDSEMPVAPILQAQSKCLVSSRAADLVLGRDGLFRPPLIDGSH